MLVAQLYVGLEAQIQVVAKSPAFQVDLVMCSS